MPKKTSLQEPGTFTLGCNYWASHAGTAMWTDWRPDVVATDLKQLADAGLQVLRVFPLWPVFQPLTELKPGGGERSDQTCARLADRRNLARDKAEK